MSRAASTLSHQPLSDVDLRLLRVFRAVVECAGFTAAEADLDVARSTISTHIATLETRLGLRLCERGRGGFSLTEPGRVVYAEAVRLLGAVDEFRSRVGAAHRRLVGELKIGVIDNLLTLPETRLPEIIGRFGQLAPEVRLSLEVMAADEIERGRASGRVHLGFYAPHRARRELARRTVATECQHLYCGRGHPLFAVSESQLDEVTLEACDLVGRSYLDEAKANDLPWRRQPAASANNLEAVLILVLSGRYLGLLPAQYAVRWEEEGVIRALRPDAVAIEKRFDLVWWRARSPSPVLKAFLDVHQAVAEAGVAGQGDAVA